jgi:hypothetical protein
VSIQLESFVVVISSFTFRPQTTSTCLLRAQIWHWLDWPRMGPNLAANAGQLSPVSSANKTTTPTATQRK